VLFSLRQANVEHRAETLGATLRGEWAHDLSMCNCRDQGLHLRIFGAAGEINNADAVGLMSPTGQRGRKAARDTPVGV
jgi:hypothetical protein